MRTMAAYAVQPPAALVEWVRSSLPPHADAVHTSVRLAQEDFFTVKEVCAQSGLTAGDLAELFPGQNTIQVALMQAIENRRALETWLLHHLPHGARITPAACADVLQQEDFNCLADLVSAGLTPTDMAELFPEQPLVVSKLLEALRASSSCTTSVTASRVEPTLTVTTGSKQSSVTDSTEANGSVDAWLRSRLPSIDVSKCACTFRSEGFMNADDVLTAGITRADLEELFPDWEPSTLAQLFNLISEDGFTRETPTNQLAQTTVASDGSRTASIGKEKTTEKQLHKTETTDITRPIAGAPVQQSAQKRKLPDPDSDDEILSFKGKKSHKRRQPRAAKSPKVPAASQQNRMSSERESLLACASSSSSVHRIIAQHAPLYDGSKDMLIRKLEAQILSQQPPGYSAWNVKSIGTAIMEICHYDCQRRKWLLKEPFCFFLDKAERRSLGYKRGILKGVMDGCSSRESDKDAAKKAVTTLTLPSQYARSTPGDGRTIDPSSRGAESLRAPRP